MPERMLRVAIAAHLSRALQRRILEREPRVVFLGGTDLLAPQRFPADFAGEPGFQRSPQQQARFDRALAEADALYGIPDLSPVMLKRTIEANPGLRWVQTMAAGGGSQVAAAALDREQLERVAFTTSAGVHGGPLAEFAILGLLAGAKRLSALKHDQHRREWPAHRRPLGQLSSQRVLVAGLGGVGSRVIELLDAFGAEVVALSRDGRARAGISETVHVDRLLEVVPEVDAIVTSLPATVATEGLFSAEVLAVLKPGAAFVNVGRGSVVDEAALVDALRSGRVGFAALDVFATEPLPGDSPLWEMDNVLISPHTAALDPLEEQRIADLFAQNATRLLDGEPLINRVDTVEFY